MAFENPSNLVYCKVLESSDEIKMSVLKLKEKNVSSLREFGGGDNSVYSRIVLS